MELNQRKPLWRIPGAIILFMATLPAGFSFAFYVLFLLFPDAGSGVMIFLPLAALAALVLAGLAAGSFLFLTSIRWWAGLPVAALVLLGLIGMGISFVTSLGDVTASLKPYCEVTNPKPGQDLGVCVAVYSVAPEQNPAAPLFIQHGWKLESGHERRETLPAEFTGMWQLWAAFSRDVKLDPGPYRGQEVRVIGFGVKGATLPGSGKDECRTWAKTVLDKDGNLIGAWIECRGLDARPSQELPGYSVSRRSVQEVTGKPWREFRRK